jgi:predicted ATPase
MSALCFASLPHVFSGRYVAANALLDEVTALADQKGSLIWKAFGMMNQGYVRALTGRTSDAIHIITAGIAAWRSTGSTVFAPSFLSYLASSYADVGQFDEALRCVDEAMAAIDTTKEKWWEAETNRLAGEIVLKSLTSDTAKAETYFERALAIARKQQAKSLELRAAMSIARLRRNQGKQNEARDLLAPIYGWFTEGFDTLDLKAAKALLDMLG